MAKYGKKASERVEKAMHEQKRGTLRSSSGKTVTSRKQAIAIGLSEARRTGGKVPSKKTASKKSTATRRNKSRASRATKSRSSSKSRRGSAKKK